MRSIINILHLILYLPLLINAQSVDTTKKGVIHVKKPTSSKAEYRNREAERLYKSSKTQTAKFPLGDVGFSNYIFKNLKYPRDAKEKKIEGTVYVSFTVDRDGNVKQPKITKGVGSGCDEEALRLIKEMPQWTPAYDANIPIPSDFNLPITFKLN